MPGEDIKIPMEVKTIFGTKAVMLSATVFKPAGGEKLPLLVLNHGTPGGMRVRKSLPAKNREGPLPGKDSLWPSPSGGVMGHPKVTMPSTQENATTPITTVWPGRL